MASKQSLNQFVINLSIQNLKVLRQLEESITRIANLNKKLSRSGVTGEVRKQANAMREVGAQATVAQKRLSSYNKSFISAARTSKNELTDMLRRVTLWSSGIALLFGSVNKVKQVFQATKDLEVSMAELQKVMGEYQPWKEIKNNLFDAGKAFSTSVDQVAEVAKIWAQQGKNYKEVADLTKTALLGVNSANLTAAQSVEFLTAVTKSYNIEATRTADVMDGIMKVQASFAITAQDLAKAFRVVGTTASVMGDDLGTVFGMVTAIGQVTRETGNVVGQSLKTQFARLAQPETIKALEQMGIKTNKLVDGVTQKLTGRTIFEQISQMIESGQLTGEQQIQIALRLGGIRKFKDALVLMKNWGEAEAAREKYLKASMDATKASNTLQDTFAKKLEKLGVVFTELGTGVLEGGLIPTLTTATEGLIDFTQKLTIVAESDFGKMISGIIPTIIGGAALMGVIKVVGKNATSSILQEMEMASAIGGRGAGFTKETHGNTVAGRILGLGKMTGAQYDKFAESQKKLLINQQKTFDQMIMTMKKAGAHSQTISKLIAEQEFYIAKQAKMAAMGQKGVFGGRFGSVASFATGKSQETLQKAASKAALTWGTVGKKATSVLGGLFKFSASIVLLELAIKGISYGLEKLFGDKSGSSINSTIDLQSQISKSFLTLYDNLKGIQIQADKAGVDIETFTDKISNVTKARTLQPIAERIGLLLYEDENTKSKIKNLSDLVEALNNVDIAGGLDIGSAKEAVDAQMLLLKYMRDEVGKELGQYRKAIYDFKKDYIKEVNEDIERSTFRISTDFKTVFPKAQDVDNVLIKVYNSLTEKLRNVDQSLPESGDVSALKNLSESDQLIAKNLVEFKQVIIDNVNIQKELRASAQKNKGTIGKVFDALLPEKTGYPNKLEDAFTVSAANIISSWNEINDEFVKAGFVDVLKEDLKEKLDLDGVIANRATTGKPSGKDPREVLKDLAYQLYDEAAEELLNEISNSSESFKELKRIIAGLGRNLKDDVGNWLSAIRAGAQSLIGLQDVIFNATNKFERELNKINLQKQYAGVTGRANFSEEDLLNATRTYFDDVTQAIDSLKGQRSQLRREEEILRDIIEKKETTVAQGIVDAIGGFLKKGIKNQADYAKLDKIQQQFAAKADDAVAQELSKKLGEILKITNNIQIAEGTLFEDSAEFDRVLGELKKYNIGITAEKLKASLKAYNESGEVDEIIRTLGELNLTNLISSVAGETFQRWFIEARDGFVQSINDLRANYQELFKTGNDFVDNQNLYLSNIERIKRNFESQIGAQSELKKRGAVSKEEYIVKLKQLETEKALALRVEELTAEYAEQEIIMQRVQQAAENFKSTTVSLISDLSNFKFDNRSQFESAFTDYLNQIASTRLEATSKGFLDNVVNNTTLGQILTGEKADEKLLAQLDEETKNIFSNLDTATGENTKAVKALTSKLSSGLTTNIVETGKDGVEKKAEEMTTGDIKAIVSEGIDVFDERLLKMVEAIKPLEAVFDGVKKTVKDTSTDVDVADTDKKLSKLDYGILAGSQMLSGVLGNVVAKERGVSGAGVGVGSAAGQIIGSAFDPTGVIGPSIGALLGGAIGGIFGRKEKRQQDEGTENLKRIAENTATLKDVDSRLINAPSTFKLPALAQTGGNVQYTGGITINVSGAGDPKAVASEINKTLGGGTFNFNNVKGNI